MNRVLVAAWKSFHINVHSLTAGFPTEPVFSLKCLLVPKFVRRCSVSLCPWVPLNKIHDLFFQAALCRESSSLVAMVWERWHQLRFAGCGNRADRHDEINSTVATGMIPAGVKIKEAQTHAGVSLWSRSSLSNLWQSLWIRGTGLL